MDCAPTGWSRLPLSHHLSCAIGSVCHAPLLVVGLHLSLSLSFSPPVLRLFGLYHSHNLLNHPPVLVERCFLLILVWEEELSSAAHHPEEFVIRWMVNPKEVFVRVLGWWWWWCAAAAGTIRSVRIFDGIDVPEGAEDAVRSR